MGCSTETPDSGLYINSLPGISLEAIDKIADSDQVTYVSVFGDIEARALARIAIDISSRLSARYKLKNPSRSLNLGDKISKDANNNPSNITAKQAGKLRGINLDMTYGDRYIDSVFKKVYVQQLNVYSTETVAGVDLKVIDLYTGNELDSFSFDAEIGWNYIKVNKSYESRNLFIGYDASKIDGVELDVLDLSRCEGYCEEWVSRLNGSEISSSNYSLLIRNNSFGLSGIFSINCSYDALVCNNKNLFKEAYWYLLGVETMTERIFSSRINKWTTIDREKAKENMIYFDNRYDESLDNTIKSINIDLSDACIECNQVLTIKETRL